MSLEYHLRELIIDCDVLPSVPPGDRMFDHIKMGKIKIIPANIKLAVLCRIQDDCYDGLSLESLYHRNSLNANVLDYLRDNLCYVKELTLWRTKKIFFFGTLYRSRMGELMVPFLERQWWYGEEYWIKGAETLRNENFDYRACIALI